LLDLCSSARRHGGSAARSSLSQKLHPSSALQAAVVNTTDLLEPSSALRFDVDSVEDGRANQKRVSVTYICGLIG
jgi:hypothetical protein